MKLIELAELKKYYNSNLYEADNRHQHNKDACSSINVKDCWNQ